MGAAEALELMAGEMAQIDATFQFWLASTFAMIVAVHTISEGAEMRIKIVLTILYLLLSVYSVTKTVGDFQQLIYLSSFTASENINMPTDVAGLAGLMRFVIYGLGSISALVFVWYGVKRQN